jgi:16S rRNA (guanine527-N7)-methyltransferase
VQDARGAFACITARAFASLPDMLAWGGHLLAPGGRWLAMKGQPPDAELAALPGDFVLDAQVPLDVPGLGAARRLVIVRRRDSE